MANEQQGQDAAWNDFLEAKRRLLQSMLDFIQAAEKAFEGHVWITLGYPEGMKGWAAYCKDNFGQQATIMRQLPKSDRRQLLLEAKSTNGSKPTSHSSPTSRNSPKLQDPAKPPTGTEDRTGRARQSDSRKPDKPATGPWKSSKQPKNITIL